MAADPLAPFFEHIQICRPFRAVLLVGRAQLHQGPNPINRWLDPFQLGQPDFRRFRDPGDAFDLDEAGLKVLGEDLKARGASVLTVLTDVSKASDVEELARQTIDGFGAVHLLFNNAGVGGDIDDLIGPMWEQTLEDWDWILGVNL